jgi:hypothetical protein
MYAVNKGLRKFIYIPAGKLSARELVQFRDFLLEQERLTLYF